MEIVRQIWLHSTVNAAHRHTSTSMHMSTSNSIFQGQELHLLKSKTGLQVYIDFEFHISKSRSSLQAYFDFKFYLDFTTRN